MYERNQGNVRVNQVNRKVIHLNELRTSQENNQGNYRELKHTKKQQHLVRKSFLFIGAVVILLVFGIPLYQTYTQSQEVQAEYEVAVKENEEAIKQYEMIKQEHQLLQDPNYIAEIARRDYFYSKPNEIIFDLGDDLAENDSIFQQTPPE